MNTIYHVIPPGRGISTAHHVDLPDKPNIDQLKQTILPYLNGGAPGGVHMERVRVLLLERGRGRYTDMFVDEDGISKQLPVNPAATKIYRANWLQQYPTANPDTLSAIYGTAVLFLRPVWY